MPANQRALWPGGPKPEEAESGEDRTSHPEAAPRCPGGGCGSPAANAGGLLLVLGVTGARERLSRKAMRRAPHALRRPGHSRAAEGAGLEPGVPGGGGERSPAHRRCAGAESEGDARCLNGRGRRDWGARGSVLLWGLKCGTPSWTCPGGPGTSLRGLGLESGRELRGPQLLPRCHSDPSRTLSG